MRKEISDFLKMSNFIATIFLLLYHIKCFIPMDNIVYHGMIDQMALKMMLELVTPLSVFAMCYFFFMSAFLLYANVDQTNAIRKIKSRIYSLGVPLVLWNIIFWRKPSSLTWLICYFTIHPNCAQLWYLWAVLMLLVFLIPILYLKKHKKLLTLIIISLIIGCVCYLKKSPFWISDSFSAYLTRLVSYLPSYLVGAWFGLYYGSRLLSNVPRISKKNTIIGGGVYIACLYLYKFVYSSPLLLMLLMLISIPAFASSIFWLARYNVQLSGIYKWSFIIYATHLQVILKIPYYKCGKNISSILVLGEFVGSVIIVLTVAGVIYNIGSKVCPTALKLLSGGRTSR